MAIYRLNDTSPAGRPAGVLMVGCDRNGCKAEMPFAPASGSLPVPVREELHQLDWEMTKSDPPKFFCLEHRVVPPEEMDRRKLAHFIETRVSLNEHDQAPTTRVWDEFTKYIGAERLNSPTFEISKRDVYAAVRALGPVEDGLLGMTINGKQTSTPVFKGISLKTTTAPEGHAEWYAKRKGGVLAKKKDVKAATLEYHRERAENRRARQRKVAPGEWVRRFVEQHLVPTDENVSSESMYLWFNRYLAQEGIHQALFTKREFMAVLAGHDLKARSTSLRMEGRRNPRTITVYDGVSIVGVSKTPPTPEEPEPITCATPGCPETALNTVAGDLGWRELDGETYCLGHAEHQDADPAKLVGAQWPSKPDLDTPGPRGREASVPIDDEIILDEDRPEGWSPDKVVQPTVDQDFESIAAEFEAMPETGIVDDDDLIYDD